MKLQPRVVILRAAVVAAAALAAVFAATHLLPAPLPQVLLFVAVLILSDLPSVTLPQGGEVSAAVGTTSTVALLFPPATAVAMVAVAGVFTLLARALTAPRRLSGLLLAERVAALAITVPILQLGRATGLEARSVELASVPGLAAGVFVVAFCLVYALLDQAQLTLSKGSGFRAALPGLVTFVAPVYLALGSLGLLAAVVYPSLGLWALVLITGLLFVVRHAFNLYSSVRTNYQATLRALAEAIEAQDPATRGHAERTADLAVRLGRELGIHGKELETLSYAALFHDIGKLATPEDSLDFLLDALPADAGYGRHHAERGAEILGQVEYLRRTAQLVRYHHHPAGQGGRKGSQAPLGARVIAVATRFDTLTRVADASARKEPARALDSMRGDVPPHFDPAVLRALETVLRESGATS